MEHSGIVVSFSDKSGHGIASFRLKGREEKAYFELDNATVGGAREPILTLVDKKIIVGMEAQLTQCVLLHEDDMHVGQHRNTVVRYKTHVDIRETAESFAKIIQTNNEMKSMTFNGVILSLTKGSGIVTFEWDGKKEKASFHQAHAHVDSIPVPRYMKLNKLFEPGMEALLTNTQRLYEENDATIGYRCYVNVIGSTKNYALKSGKHVPLCKRNFCGTVESVKEVSGLVSFQLYEQEESAYFYKPDTSVAGKHLARDTPLTQVVSVGQEVTLSFVERLTGDNDDGILYKAQVNIEEMGTATEGDAAIALKRKLLDEVPNQVEKKSRSLDEVPDLVEKKSRSPQPTEITPNIQEGSDGSLQSPPATLTQQDLG